MASDFNSLGIEEGHFVMDLLPLMLLLAVLSLLGVSIFGAILYSLFNRQRSLSAGVVCAGIGLLMLIASRYSYTKMLSDAWAVGYLLVALLAIIGAIRNLLLLHLFPKSKNAEPR